MSTKHISSGSVDSILDKMSQYNDYSQYCKDTLYHGTCEEIVGSLTTGAYDNILWTAKTPDVAQTYIPDAGITTTLVKPSQWEIDERIRVRGPGGIEIEMARALGYEFDVELDEYFRVKSYSVKKDGTSSDTPTNREIWEYMTNTLGYKEDRDNMIHVKSTYVGDNHVYLKAEHKMPGELYVLSNVEQLNFFDMSTGEGDLMDLQYHKMDMFKKLEEEGYDGVIIDDFCQTKIYGNTSHLSYGIFSSALYKLETRSLFATHHEWDEESMERGVGKTADFDAEDLFERAKTGVLLTAEKEEEVISNSYSHKLFA